MAYESEQLRGRLAGISQLVVHEFNLLMQQNPGLRAEMGNLPQMMSQLAGVLADNEAQMNSFVNNQPPAQQISPEAQPQPEGGSQGKISPGNKQLVSWLRANCKFASAEDDAYLATQVALLLHHVEDCLKGIDEGDLGYAKKGLNDIREVAEGLQKELPKEMARGVDRALEGENVHSRKLTS